ncbi:DUF1761 domain-containing protein [Ruania halotolerans]|uniref:DUF1761 domain-containing protein n=1 Tax=Ruania halotolerans TaxID=2897773 RepID=UPI001E4B68A8|nr:DUF1761 domain-containing protein [Ruania halotolerans]UFU07869.1 DUF1761 domain-containing protein [Ruania halotolerans]
MLALGIAVATLAAFIISSVFYALMPQGPPAKAAPQERPRPGQIVIELLRSATVSGLVAGLLVTAGWAGPAQGVLLGLALWALPVVLLTGSVLWEKAPARSAATHAVDWLIKLVAIGLILGLFT